MEKRDSPFPKYVLRKMKLITDCGINIGEGLFFLVSAVTYVLGIELVNVIQQIPQKLARV